MLVVDYSSLIFISLFKSKNENVFYSVYKKFHSFSLRSDVQIFELNRILCSINKDFFFYFCEICWLLLLLRDETPGVCFTFGWPYCIERGCHENFLSCGSSVASFASTNAVDADYHLSCVLDIVCCECALALDTRYAFAAEAPIESNRCRQPFTVIHSKIHKRKYSPHFDMHVDLFIYLPTSVWFLARANSTVVHTAKRSPLYLDRNEMEHSIETNSRFTCRTRRIVVRMLFAIRQIDSRTLFMYK